MKIKAKESYKDLDLKESFYGLGSASTHILLLDNKEVEWDNAIPKKLKEHIIEVKAKKGDK